MPPLRSAWFKLQRWPKRTRFNIRYMVLRTRQAPLHHSSRVNKLGLLPLALFATCSHFFQMIIQSATWKNVLENPIGRTAPLSSEGLVEHTRRFLFKSI